MTLDELEIGKDAIVASVDCDDASLRQHIFDMGLTPGIEVTMIKLAPMGDPMEIRLRGYELTLRRDDAARCAGNAQVETLALFRLLRLIPMECPKVERSGKWRLFGRSTRAVSRGERCAVGSQ